MNDRTHKEVLTNHKLTMLIKGAQKAIDTGNTIIAIQHFKDNINDYNNWQKLRYHGLIWHYAEHGQIKRGKWIITKNGWAFLRGELDLPKYVLIRENHIIDHSIEKVNIRQIYHAAQEVITVFEYYDDTGRYTGQRPMREHQQQVSLL